ncbi:MAG: phosphoribosylaminoimidazolesuccinocarboxamide synthase [Phycisphaerae bacterium]
MKTGHRAATRQVYATRDVRVTIPDFRETHLPAPPPLPAPLKRGKVRDLYALPNRLLIVASDRISAFDVVMNEPVRDKGVLLTQLSQYWLETLPACSPHHLDYVVSPERVPAEFAAHAAQLAGRAMVAYPCAILPIECVVRGYLVGGGWKEYVASGRVSGVPLPAGLRLAQKLAEPIFTPSTKAEDGHDLPIAFDQACATASAFLASIGAPHRDGAEVMRAARRRALELYAQAAERAAQRGVLIADTKLEFGIRDGALILCDEVLTPDSSRFWPADEYRPGTNPPSFDKQYLRDYLESLDWNKTPPPPPLPHHVLDRTRQKYVEAYERLTERKFA